MKLFLINQDVNTAYDTYDSAVVYAEDKEAARLVHPDDSQNPWNGEDITWATWCTAKDVKVTEIGLCHPSQLGTSGVICASFNAE